MISAFDISEISVSNVICFYSFSGSDLLTPWLQILGKWIGDERTKEECMYRVQFWNQTFGSKDKARTDLSHLGVSVLREEVDRDPVPNPDTLSHW